MGTYVATLSPYGPSCAGERRQDPKPRRSGAQSMRRTEPRIMRWKLTAPAEGEKALAANQQLNQCVTPEKADQSRWRQKHAKRDQREDDAHRPQGQLRLRASSDGPSRPGHGND